jgi:hypothetical protein
MSDTIIFKYPESQMAQDKIWDALKTRDLSMESLLPGVYVPKHDTRGFRAADLLRPVLQSLAISYLTGHITSFFTTNPRWQNLVDLGTSRVGEPSAYDLYLVLSEAGSAGLLTWLNSEGLPAKSLVDGAVLTSPPSDAAAANFHDGLRSGLQALRAQFAIGRLMMFQSNNAGWMRAR